MSAFSEEQIDYMERFLSAAGVSMPVLVKPCGLDEERVTLAGWRAGTGPICHIIPHELVNDPTRRAELTAALQKFLQLLELDRRPPT